MGDRDYAREMALLLDPGGRLFGGRVISSVGCWGGEGGVVGREAHQHSSADGPAGTCLQHWAGSAATTCCRALPALVSPLPERETSPR